MNAIVIPAKIKFWTGYSNTVVIPYVFQFVRHALTVNTMETEQLCAS